MRAKLENSSTMRRRSPTWRTIVPVSRSKVSGSDVISAIAALQPLGGELDRGQRVLDLMGDAPGDVGPGGAALVGQLVGDVVEGQHRCRRRSAPLDRERALPAFGAITRRWPRALAAHEFVELGRHIGQVLALELLLALLQQRLGRAVDEQDAVRNRAR
jgi:hypothetical protein